MVETWLRSCWCGTALCNYFMSGEFMNFSSSGLAVGIALLAMSTTAQAITIQNGSFELGTFSAGSNNTPKLTPGSSALTGWTILSDDIAWLGAGNPFNITASHGDRAIDLTGFSDTDPLAGVSQQLDTVVGNTYKLSFDLGSSQEYGTPTEVEVSAGSTSNTFSTVNLTGNDVWESFSMTFTATSTATELVIMGLTGNRYIGLDNVGILEAPGNNTTPVPVPASALLLGTALLGLRRFKAKSKA